MTTEYGDGTPEFTGPVELLGTCDWGRCDDPGETVRWSKDHGWLTVCGPCDRPYGGKRGGVRPGDRAGTAQCPTCGRWYSLRRDGTLRDHRWRPVGNPRDYVVCPGGWTGATQPEGAP